MKRAKRIIRSGSGFSLVELMVAVAVFSVIAAMATTFMAAQRRSAARQEASLDAQQQARAAMDLMAREIRIAGSGLAPGEAPLRILDPARIEFMADLNGAGARLRSAAAAGDAILSVTGMTGSSAFRKNKSILVCSVDDCEWHHLERDATGSLVFIAEPLGRDFPAGSDLRPINRVRYELKKGDSPERFRLMRRVDGGSSTVAEGIGSLAFDYLDTEGRSEARPEAVARVDIRLSALSVGAPSGRRALESAIAIRNWEPTWPAD